MKKLLLGLTITSLTLCAALYSSPVRAAEDEVNLAAAGLTGTWTCVETYDCCGDYPSSWTFSSTGKKVLTLSATRTSADITVAGKAIELGPLGLATHPQYGGGDCKYKFSGKVVGSTFSGKAKYSCPDGYVTQGTFTATKATAQEEEDIEPLSNTGGMNPR